MTSKASVHPVMKSLNDGETAIGVIGLGYVGLPLAASFAKKFRVIGFDINQDKIAELRQGIDRTRELDDLSILKHKNLRVTADAEELKNCRIIIVAVPTPVTDGRSPDLRPVISASQTVGAALGQASTYICYESTVYPGCTEDDCRPVLEKVSGKKHGKDFFLGFSPERINPGDKEHRFETITKVVSGCCDDSLELFSQLYGSVVLAGVHRAPTIKVAEAAKVIENTQRDLNIALMNELSMIFARLGVDTRDVLEAAGTKWNFLRFFPGLVGGHCIGVDPYYLTHKAQTVGYVPQVILAGRGVNDGMAEFVVLESIKRTIDRAPLNGDRYRALVLGFTFKENVPDVRNTKVIDLVNSLRSFRFEVDVVDPVADQDEIKHEYAVDVSANLPSTLDGYDLALVAVGHDEFKKQMPLWVKNLKSRNQALTLIDIKALLSNDERAQLSSAVRYWRM